MSAQLNNVPRHQFKDSRVSEKRENSSLLELNWPFRVWRQNTLPTFEKEVELYKGPAHYDWNYKKSLSPIHTTTFFHNGNDFFNSFIYGQRFSQQFSWKNLCENYCSVRGALNHSSRYPTVSWILIKRCDSPAENIYTNGELRCCAYI